jgi:DNA-binding MarR family transcriptional regulator
MSRDLILEQLLTEIRGNQRATDLVDDLAAGLLGINRSDARCFDVLDERGRVSAGELAAATRLTTGAITAVIDRLERAGYARRVPDPNDRRRVLVEITEAARKATAEIMGPIAVDSEPLIASYSDAELELIVGFTRRGRELQEHHADRLRAMIEERKKRAG